MIYVFQINQTAKMENGHRHLIDEDEDVEEIIVLSDSEELVSKRSSPVPIVMPCTSSTDAVRPEQGRRRRTRTYIEFAVTQTARRSLDEVICTDDGEHGVAGDGEMSDEQPTLQSNNHAEIPAAWLIVKAVKEPDEVDRFLPYAGSMLRSIQDEQKQQILMRDIMRILINAKTEEMQTLSQSRLQYIVVLFRTL